MKLIGLLGGLGWEATSRYYRMMNEFIQRELGSYHSARILLHSVNYSEIRESSGKGDLDRLTAVLSGAGRSLKAGGADFIVIANNTMHQFADEIQCASGLDLLHIADSTGQEIRKAGHQTVALLGTRATMEAGFYAQRLLNGFGTRVITPEPDEQAEVNRLIYDELAHGVVRAGSREFLGDLIRKLQIRGAEALILGCSELTAIVPPDSGAFRIYDTTRLHARAAVNRAIEATMLERSGVTARLDHAAIR